jgi:hypothetical protein
VNRFESILEHVQLAQLLTAVQIDAVTDH